MTMMFSSRAHHCTGAMLLKMQHHWKCVPEGTKLGRKRERNLCGHSLSVLSCHTATSPNGLGAPTVSSTKEPLQTLKTQVGIIFIRPRSQCAYKFKYLQVGYLDAKNTTTFKSKVQLILF